MRACKRGTLLLLLSIGLARCAEDPSEQRIDERLMAALGQARALHHLADVHLAEGEADKAEEALERILEIQFPTGAPERDDVIVDAYGRLAKVRLGKGQIDDAEATLERGFREARRDTFYKAALHLTLGEIEEARATEARARGDSAAANAAARRAIEAYELSIAINQRVMDRLAREAKEEQP